MLPEIYFDKIEKHRSSSCPIPQKGRRVSIFSINKEEETLKKPATHIAGESLSHLYDPSKQIVYLNQCYDLFKFLKNGSYGVISSVRSKENFQFYVLKHSVKKFSKYVDKLFLDEIHRHKNVPKHLNLLQLLCAWDEKGHKFIKMQLCCKGDLEQRFIKVSPKPILENNLFWSYFIDTLLVCLLLFLLLINILY